MFVLKVCGSDFEQKEYRLLEMWGGLDMVWYRDIQALGVYSKISFADENLQGTFWQMDAPTLTVQGEPFENLWPCTANFLGSEMELWLKAVSIWSGIGIGPS